MIDLTYEQSPSPAVAVPSVVDTSATETPPQSSISQLQITVLKTGSGTYLISPLQPSTTISPGNVQGTSPVSPALDQLSPSQFLEMRNRKILKRRIVTKLPRNLQTFKQKKLASLRSAIWRPRGPKPINSRVNKQQVPPAATSTPKSVPIQFQTISTTPVQSEIIPAPMQQQLGPNLLPKPTSSPCQLAPTLLITQPAILASFGPMILALPPAPTPVSTPPKPPSQPAQSPTSNITVIRSPSGPIEVLVKKAVPEPPLPTTPTLE